MNSGRPENRLICFGFPDKFSALFIKTIYIGIGGAENYLVFVNCGGGEDLGAGGEAPARLRGAGSSSCCCRCGGRRRASRAFATGFAGRAGRRIKRGDVVLLEGIGGGFAWGAVLLRY